MEYRREWKDTNSNNDKSLFKSSSPEKVLRYTKDSFTKELIGRVVKIKLTDSEIVQGRLIEVGMYDIKIQTAQAQLIVMKSAILTVEVVP